MTNPEPETVNVWQQKAELEVRRVTKREIANLKVSNLFQQQILGHDCVTNNEREIANLNKEECENRENEESGRMPRETRPGGNTSDD